MLHLLLYDTRRTLGVLVLAVPAPHHHTTQLEISHRVQTRDLRSFEIRLESAVRFDSKVIGRFENFRIESAVRAPLLLISLVKRLKPLMVLNGTVYRLASSMSDQTPVV